MSISPKAPPVYRPKQSRHSAVQPTPAHNFRLETRPAPPVYRPRQSQSGLQPKPAENLGLERRPAPPVYRPYTNAPPVVGAVRRQSQIITGPRAFGVNGRPPAATMQMKAIKESTLANGRRGVEPRGFQTLPPPLLSRVVQRSTYEELGQQDDPQQMLQVQALLPARQLDEFHAQFQGNFYGKKTSNGKGLVVSAPGIELRGLIQRDNLPNGVDPDDNFGWLQTIYKSVCDGWYVIDRAKWPIHYTRRLPWSEDDHNEINRTFLFGHGEVLVDYQRWTQEIRELPAADLGEHPIFYDAPANFTNDLLHQQLFGSGAQRESLGTAMSDKPQDVYPLRTPDDIGRIGSYSGAFHAVSWLVAMKANNPKPVHYFYHVEWKISYAGSVDANGVIQDSSTRQIVDQGPGKGLHAPVMGGTPANEMHRTVTWSTPVTDPLGLL